MSEFTDEQIEEMKRVNIWGRMCEICEQNQGVVVCSVPSFPISMLHCQRCLTEGVYPMFCVETIFCDDRSSLKESVQRHREKVMSVGADWFMDSNVWVKDESGGGSVMVIRDLLQSFLQN